MNTFEKLKYDLLMEKGSNYEYLSNTAERMALLEKGEKEKIEKFSQALAYMVEAHQAYSEAYLMVPTRQDDKEINHALVAVDRTKERKESIIKRMDNTKIM